MMKYIQMNDCWVQTHRLSTLDILIYIFGLKTTQTYMYFWKKNVGLKWINKGKYNKGYKEVGGVIEEWKIKVGTKYWRLSWNKSKKISKQEEYWGLLQVDYPPYEIWNSEDILWHSN